MRTSVFPRGHWRWPVAGNYSHGIRVGDLILVGGQTSITADGKVGHAGDHLMQMAVAVENVAGVLGECGADLDDLVKLVVYYVNRGEIDEWALLAHLRRVLGPHAKPAVTAIPVPHLPVPGLVVEIEAVAMRGADGARLPRTIAAPPGHWSWPEKADFAHGVRCGQMIFVSGQMALDDERRVLAPGDIVQQSHIVLHNIAAVLGEFGANLDDSVRFFIFYRGTGTTEDWEVAVKVRASYFTEPGPCGTAIPVPTYFPEDLTIKMEVWAMLGEDGSRLPREHSWPEGHWDWSVHLPFKHGCKCGNLIFVGGQVPTDDRGRTLAVGDIEAQTDIAMRYLERVVASYGRSLDDVIKVSAFYADESSKAAMARNLGRRSTYFADPGPTTTEVSVPFLALTDMWVEFEAIAASE